MLEVLKNRRYNFIKQIICVFFFLKLMEVHPCFNQVLHNNLGTNYTVIKCYKKQEI